MGDRTLLTELTYATLLSLDGGKSSGSGFLLHYKDHDYLVTARHVLFDENDQIRCETLLISSQNSRGQIEDAKMIEITMTDFKVLESKPNDVSVLRLGKIATNEFEEHITLVQEGNLKPTVVDQKQIRHFDEIGIANEVYLVGFPTSLIFQNSKHFDPGKPLLRKGIVAGVNTADQTFIIDCSAYYGNSGAPVIELCEDGELRVVGVVSRYIPFVIEWRNNRETSVTHAEYLNSGYSVCIPMNAVIELIN